MAEGEGKAWTVARLKAALKARGLPATGRKAELAARLAAAERSAPALPPKKRRGRAAPAEVEPPEEQNEVPVAPAWLGAGEARGALLSVRLADLPAAPAAESGDEDLPGRGEAAAGDGGDGGGGGSSNEEEEAGEAAPELASPSPASSDSEDEPAAGGLRALLARRRPAVTGRGGATAAGPASKEEDWRVWHSTTGLPGALSAEAAARDDARRDAAVRRKEAEQREVARRRPKGEAVKWHDIPERELTQELKRELRLLKLRGATDPKRFYKAADSTKLSTRFHIGTVIEGPADFYSSRLTKRERKQTFAEELLADPKVKAYAKRKFQEVSERQRPAKYQGKHARKTKKRRKSHKGFK